MISPVADTPRVPLVHLVDDDESVRKALTRLLQAAGYAVRSYSSAGDFALKHSDRQPGCLLLDIRMPGPTGLDLQEALCQDKQPLPVIFLTGHGDIETSVRAMKAGAVDFLTKPVKREALLGAVRSAIARDQSQTSSYEETEAVRSRFNKLTEREKDVFRLVVAGLLNKQIAGELGIAERTVKAHRAQVMAKMDVTSLAALVHLADKI